MVPTDIAVSARARMVMRRWAVPSLNSAIWPAAALLIIAGLQFPQLFHRAINWDEFWHYSQIRQLEAGTLTRPLLTLHTRLFSWVTDLPGTGVDHIVIIRLFMFGCEIAVVAAIASIAARFSNWSTGLLCALAYLTFPYVFQHGYSFRFDPPAAALLMGSLWLLASARLDAKVVLLAGALLGVAAMVTIKVALFAPCFAGMAWLRWTEERFARSTALRIVAVGAVGLLTFAALFLFHSQGIGGDDGSEGTKAVLSRSAGSMFGPLITPYLPYALLAAALSPLTALLILSTPMRLLRSDVSAAQRWALLGMFLPFLTLFFYHNTAPYFYVFMLPPVLVACSLSMRWLSDRLSVAGMALALLITGLLVVYTERESPIEKQRVLLRTADNLFPGGVSYFDFCGFLGSFPKANEFMTPVGIAAYQASGTTMRDTMAQTVVPLVMDNDPMFARLFADERPTPEFLPSDAAALRSSYVHFWGPFWLAGKRIEAGRGEYVETFLVPGPYTVRGGSLWVDGTQYVAGDVVTIDRGDHRLGAEDGAAAKLVWGERLPVPDEPPPTAPLWAYF